MKLLVQAPAEAAELCWRYPIKDSEIKAFRRHGFVHLESVLNEGTLAALRSRLLPLVSEGGKSRRTSDYGMAFRYCMHAWLCDEFVRQVTLCRRLASIAAELLGVNSVRLSHDQAMFKEPAGIGTPTHADQFHLPLASDNVVSIWVPLQPVPVEMGTLSFFEGSHLINPSERESLVFAPNQLLDAKLRTFLERAEPYEVGDISAHYGWTFHRSFANTTDKTRAAFGVVYAVGDVTVRQPFGDISVSALSHWSPGAKVGEPLRSTRNPIVFSRR